MNDFVYHYCFSLFLLPIFFLPISFLNNIFYFRWEFSSDLSIFSWVENFFQSWDFCFFFTFESFLLSWEFSSGFIENVFLRLENFCMLWESILFCHVVSKTLEKIKIYRAKVFDGLHSLYLVACSHLIRKTF